MIITSVFILIAAASFAQQEKAVKGAYIDTGLGSFNRRLFRSARTASAGAGIHFRRNNSVSFDYRYGWFLDPAYPPIPSFVGYTGVMHRLRTISLYAGRTHYFTKRSFLHIAGGPSYVHYIHPENIVHVYSHSWFDSENYTYDEVSYYLPGATIKCGVSFMTKYLFGMGISGYYTYNRMQPEGGLELNMVLGTKFIKKDK